MASIVVVYNDKRALNEILLPSVKNQTAKCEFIPIDNTKGQFKSAAEARVRTLSCHAQAARSTTEKGAAEGRHESTSQ